MWKKPVHSLAPLTLYGQVMGFILSESESESEFRSLIFVAAQCEH